MPLNFETLPSKVNVYVCVSIEAKMHFNGINEWFECNQALYPLTFARYVENCRKISKIWKYATAETGFIIHRFGSWARFRQLHVRTSFAEWKNQDNPEWKIQVQLSFSDTILLCIKMRFIINFQDVNQQSKFIEVNFVAVKTAINWIKMTTNSDTIAKFVKRGEKRREREKYCWFYYYLFTMFSFEHCWLCAFHTNRFHNIHVTFQYVNASMDLCPGWCVCGCVPG